MRDLSEAHSIETLIPLPSCLIYSYPNPVKRRGGRMGKRGEERRFQYVNLVGRDHARQQVMSLTLAIQVI